MSVRHRGVLTRVSLIPLSVSASSGDPTLDLGPSSASICDQNHNLRPFGNP